LRAGLVALAVVFVLNASYYMWWGGASAGPRHLVPVLPVLAVGVAQAFRSKRTGLVVLSAACAVLSIANVLAITAVGLEAPRSDILREFAWPRVFQGKVAAFSGASNLGIRFGLRGVWSLVPFVLWCGLGCWYLVTTLRKSRGASKRGLKQLR
jgi:hypothetical protein